MSKVVKHPISFGIDLGTTNSYIGFVRPNDEVVVFCTSESGSPSVPSYVSYRKGGEIVVGEAACNAIETHCENTIYNSKRLIGHKITEDRVKNDLSKWQFKVVCDDDGNPVFEVPIDGDVKRITPIDVAAEILNRLAGLAEDFTNTKRTEVPFNVIITVPAYFTGAQIEATKEAGKKAGLTVLHIVKEPTAAAIAYGNRYFKSYSSINKKILVYDFGGGTFDVSIIEVNGREITVLATNGDDHLGGEDVTNNICEYYENELRKVTNKDLNKKKHIKLRRACEAAKRLLSDTTESYVDFPSLEENEVDNLLTHSLMDELNKDLFNRTIQLVKNTVENLNLKPTDIDDVVLVGGSSRIHKIKELLTEYFGKAPFQDIHPDEAVCFGAAILSFDMLRGIKIEISNERDELNIKKSKTTTSGRKVVFIDDKSGNEVKIKRGKKVRVDINGNVLDEEFNGSSELHIKDILSHNLGVEIKGGKISKVLTKGMALPSTHTSTYTTSYDNQPFMELRIYEGDSDYVADDLYLGTLHVPLPKRPKTEVRLEVSFLYDKNNILHITAKDNIEGRVNKYELSADKKKK